MAINKKDIFAWAEPSSKGTHTYELILYEDGTMSCNCPGWFLKAGKKKDGDNSNRSCKHTKKHLAEAANITSLYKQGKPLPARQRGAVLSIPDGPNLVVASGERMIDFD